MGHLANGPMASRVCNQDEAKQLVARVELRYYVIIMQSANLGLFV